MVLVTAISGQTLGTFADRFAATPESQAVYPAFLGDRDGDGVADGNAFLL